MSDEAGSNLDPRALKDAARGRHRRHPLFGTPDYRPFTIPGFGPGRGRYIDWILLVFPLWVLLISIYILIDNLRRPSQTAATIPGQTNS